MGYKKISDEQELQLVQDYIDGTPVNVLMKRYNFKTKKSITDKIKKHYPNNYKELIEQARQNRKGYTYKLEKISNEFDAYFLGLIMTDGYVTGDKVGIDLTDEDCISFLSKSINKNYNIYPQEGYKTRYRLLLTDKELVENLKRFGITERKSYTLSAPNLYKEEEKYLPYLLRGIIDGDGSVSPTSYDGAHFFIVTMSEEFKDWLVDILENKLFMIDVHTRQNTNGLWRIETSNQYNILKLIALVYNKPFGMKRKYEQIRKTFRDYNNDPLLENTK